MNRRKTIAFGAVASLAAAAGVGVSVWRPPSAASSASVALPPSFWAMRFARPEGGELALSDFRHRPLLINFWATWCPPCVRELPEFDRFARQQAAGGVQTIALAIDAPAPVREFLQRVPLKLSIGLAGLDGSDLSRQLGNAQGALPFTVLLAADGTLAQSRLGETSRAQLDQWAASISLK